MAIRVGIIGRNFVVDWMLAAMEQVWSRYSIFGKEEDG